MKTTVREPQKRAQLIEDGFCVFEGTLPSELLEQLRSVTEELLAAQTEEEARQQRSTGSMISVFRHPIFVDLIALPTALDALAALGYSDPRFTSGYIISKPPRSPRLFWHYDWAGWDDPNCFGSVPQQVFLMYYLTDTTPENGCLRVIPGSHVRNNSLLPLLQEAHSKEMAEARDLDLPEFSTRPDEVDVPVKAGDVVIGDSRLLHASHANDSDERRTVITLWYHPDMRALDERTQAFIARMSSGGPPEWPESARQQLEPLRARYEGPAEPLPWNRHRPPMS